MTSEMWIALFGLIGTVVAGVGGAWLGARASEKAADRAVQAAEKARPDPLALRLMEEQLHAYKELARKVHEMEDMVWDAVVGDGLPGSTNLRDWSWQYVHIADARVLHELERFEQALKRLAKLAVLKFEFGKPFDGAEFIVREKVVADARQALIEAIRASLCIDPLGEMRLSMLGRPKDEVPALPGVSNAALPEAKKTGST